MLPPNISEPPANTYIIHSMGKKIKEGCRTVISGCKCVLSPLAGIASWSRGSTGQHVREICITPFSLPGPGLAWPCHTQPASWAQCTIRVWAGVPKPQSAARLTTRTPPTAGPRPKESWALPCLTGHRGKGQAQSFVQFGNNFGACFLAVAKYIFFFCMLPEELGRKGPAPRHTMSCPHCAPPQHPFPQPIPAIQGKFCLLFLACLQLVSQHNVS